MLSKNEFETRFAAYLYGELPADQQQEMVEYLQAHPEAAGLERDLRALVEVGREAAGIPLPEGLGPRIAQEVSAHLARQTVEEAPRPQEVSRDGKWVRWKTRPGRRRLFRSRAMKSLAAVAAIAAVLTIYWFARELAWARVYAETISRLKRVHSFRVEGTILAPGGSYQPFRMWLQMPNRFRVEIGDPGQRRVITHKEGKRLIFSEKDNHYDASEPGAEQFGPSGRPIDELIAKDLGVPVDALLMAEVEKEDRGDTTRYITTEDKRWHARKHIVEVKRSQRLLARARTMDEGQDQWVMVSDLSYADFNASFPESLFDLTPPEGAVPYSEAEAEELWYERSLSTSSAIIPTSLKTATMTVDYILKVLSPEDIPGMGFGGGCGGGGGTCQWAHFDRPVPEVFMMVAWYPVIIDDPILLRQVVPLKIEYRDGLPVQKRIAGLCELLGVKAVVSPWQDSLVTEVYFEQDGRPIPASPCSTSVSHFGDLGDGRDGITARCLPLENLVTNVWGGSMINGSWVPSRAIMRRPPDPEADDPFATRIDVDYIRSTRNWDENAAWLEEHYGVTGQIVQSPIRLRHIQVSPGLPTPDGVSSYSQYAAGQLEDCYPNPADPNTTIPFVLKEAAEVALRVFSEQGQLVRTVDLGKLIQGRHEVSWEGQDQAGQPVTAGTYRYRLEVNGIATSAKKVDLIR